MFLNENKKDFIGTPHLDASIMAFKWAKLIT